MWGLVFNPFVCYLNPVVEMAARCRFGRKVFVFTLQTLWTFDFRLDNSAASPTSYPQVYIASSICKIYNEFKFSTTLIS